MKLKKNRFVLDEIINLEVKTEVDEIINLDVKTEVAEIINLPF